MLLAIDRNNWKHSCATELGKQISTRSTYVSSMTFFPERSGCFSRFNRVCRVGCRGYESISRYFCINAKIFCTSRGSNALFTESLTLSPQLQFYVNRVSFFLGCTLIIQRSSERKATSVKKLCKEDLLSSRIMRLGSRCVSTSLCDHS